MEKKEYQTINGVHVYEITWDTTNKLNVGNLPVEVDLPFRTSYNDDVINEASIFDGLTALYDCMPTGFKFEYKYLVETNNETEFWDDLEYAADKIGVPHTEEEDEE